MYYLIEAQIPKGMKSGDSFDIYIEYPQAPLIRSYRLTEFDFASMSVDEIKDFLDHAATARRLSSDPQFTEYAIQAEDALRDILDEKRKERR